MENFIRQEFYNREKELEDINNILRAQPTLITFIYGPINSGKTELINHLIKNLPDNYKVFYINLRGRFIKEYEDFIKVLFDIEYKERFKRIKEFLKPLIKTIPESYHGIPIPKDIFLQFFEKKEVEDAFVYIETVLKGFFESGFIPVLILDELQVIGDIKIDDLLIYKLFNFFVRLTKELHLSNVFAITSDSLFIENIYNEAMLQGRCRYILVDDFSRETTFSFLDKYGFNEKEKEIAWHYCGGKPVCLVELIRTKSELKKKAKEMLKIRVSQIRNLLNELRLRNIEFGGQSIKKEDVLEIFERFRDKDYVEYEEVDYAELFLVKKNVLFMDPANSVIKPQSKLDLLAIRSVIA